MRVRFEEIPETGRIWIFSSEKPLDQNDQSKIREKLEPFLERWKSEGKLFQSGFEIRENRFLIVGGNDTGFSLSGCTMDALQKFISKIGEELGSDFTTVPRFCFRSGDEIKVLSQAQFKDEILKGVINKDTIVFDNTIIKVNELQNSFEKRLQDSWHNRTLELTLKKAGISS